MQSVNIYYAGFVHRVGGAYFHVVNIEKGLKELGYKVNIITLDNLPFLIKYLPHLAEKIVNKLYFPLGFLYKQKLIKFFYKLKYKNKADIDIFEDIYTYWKSDVKSLVVLHALWSDNLQAFNFTENKRVFLEELETKIINNIDSSVVTVSNPYKDFLLKRLVNLNKNIDVVELGVDLKEFKVSEKKSNKSFVFVGSLEERKNIKFLLMVFAKLVKLDNYSLTIIGDGPQKEELTNFIENENIISVSFLGRLSYEQVIKELTNHEFYIHTSTKESFSYSLLEAKLSGLTTIANKNLEVPEEFIDIKVNDFNIDEWVEKIINQNKEYSSFNSNKFSYENMTINSLKHIK